MRKTFPVGSSNGFATRFWRSHPTKHTAASFISGVQMQTRGDCSTRRNASAQYLSPWDLKPTNCQRCRLRIKSDFLRELTQLSAHTAPHLQISHSAGREPVWSSFSQPRGSHGCSRIWPISLDLTIMQLSAQIAKPIVSGNG